jgi:ATP-dependent Clp endopeptidase proteolytic subunit ClpP
MDIQEKLHERRIVALSDNINSEQADKLRRKLLEFELESDREILLIIDSDGGGTASALSICDAISCLRAPITGIVVGECSSMAVVVLQMCAKRKALKYARFLLHFLSTNFSFSNHLSDEDIEKLYRRRLVEGRNGQIYSEQVIAGRTGKPVEEIRELMLDGDTLDARLNAEEAKKLNLIDEIIDDPKGLFSQQK